MNSFYSYSSNLLLERVFDRDCESTCKDFVQFCKKHLDLNDRVKIQFIDEHDPDITTGCYIPDKRQIKVLVKDRGLIDVLRSIAHEMVHQYQHVTGALNDKSGETGSEHENEAHAVAGIIMRLYQTNNKDKIY